MKIRKGYEYVSHNKDWMRTIETTWPTPALADEIQYVLRYGEPSRNQLLAAASILSAYSALCRTDGRTRALIVKGLGIADANKEKE